MSRANVIVHEPGTVKGYWGRETWPSVEQQVKDAQAHNRERYSRTAHKPVQLYMMTADCPHGPVPDEREEFEDVHEVEERWMEESLGLTAKNPYPYSDSVMHNAYYDMYWRNKNRARFAVPLLSAYYRADEEFYTTHDSHICKETPMGFACAYCDESSLDYGEGVSDEGCKLESELQEEQENFWHSVSDEMQEWRNRNED